MGELANCPNCGAVFVKNQFRDICEKCWKEEEDAFDMIRQFIRKRENRSASMGQIVEGTGVSEDLVLKFIKKGRLNLTKLPNVGYPCESCGKMIQSGKLCESCARDLRKDLATYKREEQRKKELEKRQRQSAYFAIDKKYRGGE